MIVDFIRPSATCRLPNSSRTPETTSHETDDVRARGAGNPIFGDAEIRPGPLRCATGPVIASFSETKADLGDLPFRAAFGMSFFRHREIFRSDVRLWNREQPAGRSPGSSSR